MTHMTNERLNEIGEFLRIRRSRLGPEECGFPKGSRRRTPGLRREEVASLASISTEWYTRLEQGRNARASEETLRQVAGALRLNPAEVNHLLRLSGYHGDSQGNRTPEERELISPQIQRFLDQQMPYPAYVSGERWDILAWNRSAEILWGDLSSMDGLKRNGMYNIFLGERYPLILQEWEKHARNCVAMLRDQGAAILEDPWFRELIDTLIEQSPRFSELWADHDIVPYLDGRKDYDIPDLGRLSFNFMALEMADSISNVLKLMVFMPLPGTGTEELLLKIIGDEQSNKMLRTPDDALVELIQLQKGEIY